MADKTVNDKLDDLVDVLDHILNETRRIADTLVILEDVIGPPLICSDERHLRIQITNASDEGIPVELQPVEDE